MKFKRKIKWRDDVKFKRFGVKIKKKKKPTHTKLMGITLHVPSGEGSNHTTL
jgi:hypothetical protein